MNSFNGDHTVSRQRQQDLVREAENRRLVKALRKGRKASRDYRRGRKVLRFATILARVLHKV
jgi:hypothetical protein